MKSNYAYGLLGVAVGLSLGLNPCTEGWQPLDILATVVGVLFIVSMLILLIFSRKD